MLIQVKKMINKISSGGVHAFIVRAMIKLHVNNDVILFTTKRAEKNHVNLDYCFNFKNLGDNISPVIVEYVAKQKNIQLNKPVKKTQHLFAVGSIITAGPQDCTVWGSGLLNTRILNRLASRKLDVRAVRGPLTRIVLMDQGYEVPEIYGDPAILMPLIYNVSVEKKYKVGLITHFNETVEDDSEDKYHRINIVTDDYKNFVREVKSCEMIVSSSLHGIIFAESYGVPAVLLKPKCDLLKYFDYYYSTGRYKFPMLENLSKLDDVCVPEIPDFTEMREKLIEAFPKDLWDES